MTIARSTLTHEGCQLIVPKQKTKLEPNWPVHDITIANVAWCMAYKRGSVGAANIAKWTCNRIAIG